MEINRFSDGYMARKTREKRRNKLINNYHDKYKRLPFAVYKIDHHQLSILLDQYYRAMEILDEQKKEEDSAMDKYMSKINGQPSNKLGDEK